MGEAAPYMPEPAPRRRLRGCVPTCVYALLLSISEKKTCSAMGGNVFATQGEPLSTHHFWEGGCHLIKKTGGRQKRLYQMNTE